MELRDYLRILHKSWILITAAAQRDITAAGASILIKPKYEATAELYDSVQGEVRGSGELVQGSTVARQSVQSYARGASTGSVLGPVITELGLDLPTAALAAQVSVAAPLATSLLTLSERDPILAANIANAIGSSLTSLVQERLEAPGTAYSNNSFQIEPVQPAAVPGAPVSPRIPHNIALGLLIYFAVGVTIAVLRSMFDTRIHSLLDSAQVTNAPLVGGIAYDAEAPRRPLIVHVDPRNPRAELYRTLRTNLQFLAENESGEQRGRSNASWEDSVRLGLHCVESWSMSGDMQILVHTVVETVVRPEAAY